MIKGLIINNMSANLTFVFGKYELSLANDTSCKKDGVLRRHSFCIFIGDKNVTSDFYPVKDEVYGVDADMVFKAMETLRKMNREWKCNACYTQNTILRGFCRVCSAPRP